MALPVPDYSLNDTGNYSSSGTVAHAHRSFVLGGAGYDLSSAPDGTVVIIWASLGHEHNDIDLTPGEVVGKVYTGNVTEYTGDPTTLTEVTGWSTTPWKRHDAILGDHLPRLGVLCRAWRRHRRHDRQVGLYRNRRVRQL